MTNTIVVIGAGVSGLTSALLLSRNKENTITIVAKHAPGDYDIQYASPWAGANFLPMLSEEDNRWESRTWPELKRLAEEVPEAGIHLQTVQLFIRNKDFTDSAAAVSKNRDALFDKGPWYKSVVTGLRDLEANEVRPGYDSGREFTSVCINTAMYLQWLVGQCLKNGVVLKRGVVSHISDAKNLSHTGRPASIIINATAMGSRALGGVQDAAMAPIRGQTVLVRNECHPMVCTSGTDDGATEMVYVMQRAAGGGTILGGTYDKGNWESVPDPNIANRIMSRVVAIVPEIAGGKGVAGLDIIRHNVGLRPFREGGVRIERQKLDGETCVVHNYGHAGWGYQGSYGCAERVVELVEEATRTQ